MDISWKVWNENNPNDQIFTGSGYCIHHKNEIHEDNRIENLQKMTIGEHSSLHNKGKIVSEDTKNKISENHCNVSGKNNPMYARKHSKTSKEKMSKSQKGEKNHLYGKSRSKEVCRKISKTLTGRKRKSFSEEWKTNISKSQKGKNRSDESKRKQSESIKNLWNDPKSSYHTDEYKKKKLESKKGKSLSKETKRKISKSLSNLIGKQIISNYKYFGSLKEAVEFLGISDYKVNSRIKAKKPGYCYVKDLINTFEEDLKNNLDKIL